MKEAALLNKPQLPIYVSINQVARGKIKAHVLKQSPKGNIFERCLVNKCHPIFDRGNRSSDQRVIFIHFRGRNIRDGSILETRD